MRRATPPDHNRPAAASRRAAPHGIARRAAHAPRAPRAVRSSPFGKIVIPCLSLGLVAAGGSMIAREIAQRPYSASTVMRDLRDLALTRGEHPGDADGGQLGPWWISASSYDPLSGELKCFRLKSGSIELSAQSARILVDPEADSIGFDLWRVVYTVLPSAANPEQLGEVIEIETYTLGPVPYGHEIYGDAAWWAPPSTTRRPTTIADAPTAGDDR